MTKLKRSWGRSVVPRLQLCNPPSRADRSYSSSPLETCRIGGELQRPDISSKCRESSMSRSLEPSFSRTEQSNDDSVQVHLRLPKPYANSLQKIAQDHDKSVSSVLRSLLQVHSKDLPLTSAALVAKGVGQTIVHVHVRLPRASAELLRKLAVDRDQTQSAVVRSLLARYSSTHG